ARSAGSIALPAAAYQRPRPQRGRRHHRAANKVTGLRAVLFLRVVQYRSAQPAHMLEERLTGQPCVVDSQCSRTCVDGELLAVTIPGRPRRLIDVQEHYDVLR